MRPFRIGTQFAACAFFVLCTGCTHHHYYGAAPICEAPVGGGRVIQAPLVAGNYCDVPGTQGTPVIVQTNPGRASTVVSNKRPPTLVTSQPVGTGLGGWRNRKDAGSATTRMSGTLDDDSLTR